MKVLDIVGYLLIALYIAFIVAVIVNHAWHHIFTILLIYGVYRGIKSSDEDREKNRNQNK